MKEDPGSRRGGDGGGAGGGRRTYQEVGCECSSAVSVFPVRAHDEEQVVGPDFCFGRVGFACFCSFIIHCAQRDYRLRPTLPSLPSADCSQTQPQYPSPLLHPKR